MGLYLHMYLWWRAWGGEYLTYLEALQSASLSEVPQEVLTAEEQGHLFINPQKGVVSDYVSDVTPFPQYKAEPHREWEIEIMQPSSTRAFSHWPTKRVWELIVSFYPGFDPSVGTAVQYIG